MTNKLKAIGKSFLMTAVPTFPILTCVYVAGWCLFDKWNNLPFWCQIIVWISALFLFVVAVLSATCFQNVLKMLKWNRLSNKTAEWLQSKGEEKHSLELVKVGSDYEIREKVEKKDSGKAAILFFAGILLSPIVLLFWVYQVFKILFSNDYSDFINSFFDEIGAKEVFKFVVVIIISVIFAFSGDLLLMSQDAKYTPDMFNFTYVSLEYDGDDWGGNLLGQSSVYYLRYEFQNTGKIKGGLEGDIIIEGRDGTKLELKDENLSVYPSNERDFEKHLVEDYIYVSKSDLATNNMLKSDSKDIKITLVIKVAGWEGGLVREYDEGKQVVLKNFGETSGSQQPGQPPQQGGTSGGVQTTEQKYQQAISLYNNGKYAEALEIFEDLNNYKQSADYIDACEEKLFYVQMENELASVAGSNAILPDNYMLQTSYSANEYILYNGNYYLGFYADFYCHRLNMQEYIYGFITKLINNGYSYVSDGVYKKANTIVQFGYFEGDDYFTYQAFKIS